MYDDRQGVVNLDDSALQDAQTALSKAIAEQEEQDAIQRPITARPTNLTFDMLGFLREANASRPGPLYIDFEDVTKCAGRVVAFDTETNGLHYWRNHVIGASFWCPAAGVYGYIPTPDEHSRSRLRELMLDWPMSTTVCLHNAKFDLHMMDIDPVKTGWRIIDTTVLVHLMDSRDRKALGPSSAKYLDENCKQEYVAWGSNLAGKGRHKLMIWEWPPHIVAEYCTSDVRLTYLLAQKLVPEIKARGQWPLFTNIMRYLGRLWRMERNGLLLDPVFIAYAKNVLNGNIVELEERLFETCGKRFNWKSSMQLSNAIWGGLGIPKPSKEDMGYSSTFKGARNATAYTESCTSSFVLMEKTRHPCGENILDLREAAKLLKYLELWEELADDTGYLHSSFNITGTRTGRLSSSKPNLQNMPGEARTRETQSAYSGKTGATREDAYNLRQAVVARPGHMFAAVDYRQQEIRMFGVLSGDENMLAALRTGEDIHGSIAKQVWGVSDNPVINKTRREWAKTVSFGLIYGMSSGSLQFRLNTTLDEANAIAHRYWSAFPRIQPWLLEVIEECKTGHYVTYWSGRRWYEDVEERMYKAGNALIQGGSHDLLMTAVGRIMDFLDTKYPEVRLVSLVHDEMDFEIPEEMMEEVLPQIQETSEVTDLFDMPFFTDIKVGRNYGVMEEWKPSAKRSN